jgi:hypothetical protein
MMLDGVSAMAGGAVASIRPKKRVMLDAIKDCEDNRLI